MRPRRLASLFLAVSICLFCQRTDATRTPLPDLTSDLTLSLVEFHPTTDERVPGILWLIESVFPLSQADDGSNFDLVVLVAPQTHTRAICVVQSPLGLAPVLVQGDPNDPTSIKWVDTYDLHYLGWQRAVVQGEQVDRGLAMTWQLPLGDMPIDAFQGESIRMRMGEGMGNAVSGLPETAFMVGQGAKVGVGFALLLGDPSGLVKAFGGGLMADGIDELQGYSRCTDTFFEQGLSGLGLSEKDISRAQFVKGAGQMSVLLLYSIPAVQEAHLAAYTPQQITASGGNVIRYHYASRQTVEEILRSGRFKALDTTAPEAGMPTAWVTRLTPSQMRGLSGAGNRLRLGLSASKRLPTIHIRNAGVVTSVEDAYIMLEVPPQALIKAPWWKAPFGAQEYLKASTLVPPGSTTGGL